MRGGDRRLRGAGQRRAVPRRHPGGLEPVGLGVRPAVVQHRAVGQHRADPRAAGVPLALAAGEHLAVVLPVQAVGAGEPPRGHPVLVTGLVEGVAAQPHLVAVLADRDHRVLDAGVAVALVHPASYAVGQSLDRVGGQAVDPPVLGARGRAGQVEPPAALAERHEHRPLEGLGAERLARHLGDRLEGDPVLGAGDDHRDAAPVGQRPADPPGQPEHAVDEDGARRPGPVARARTGCGHHDLDVVVGRRCGNRGGHAPTIVDKITRVRDPGPGRSATLSR